MTEQVIIGLSAYGSGGKDSLASFLVGDFGFDAVSFADPMRLMAAAMNPIVGFRRTWYGRKIPVRYNDAVDEVGYDAAKIKYEEFRRFLQRLGSDAGRGVLGENFWVDVAMKRTVGKPRVVFTDMRFWNEAKAATHTVSGVKRGFAVRIERPGVGPANDHISEVELVKGVGWPFDFKIDNDGTLEDLRAKAHDLAHAVGL